MATSVCTIATRSALAATSIPTDADVDGGLRREWAKRSRPTSSPTLNRIGVLNDDDNSVGAVHLGLVYAADADGRPVEHPGARQARGAFATCDEVAAVADKLETWSALLFEFWLAQTIIVTKT